MRTDRRQMIIPVVIFGGAILLRLFFLCFRYVVCFDEVNYLKLGITGAQSGFHQTLHPFWSPFFPFLLSLIFKITNHYELAGRILSILLQSLIVFPLFKIVKKNYTVNAAIWSGLLYAISPSIAFSSSYIHSESVYTFLVFSGLYLGWQILCEKNLVKSILLGSIWGFAYLTRPEGIGYIVVFVMLLAILFVYSWISKKQNPLIYIYIGILVTVSSLIVSLPYLSYLKKETGQWTISAKAETQKQGEAYALIRTEEESDRFRMLQPEKREILIDQMWHTGSFIKYQSASEKPTISVSLRSFLKKYTNNLYDIWKDRFIRVLTPVVFLLFGLGFFCQKLSGKLILYNLYLLSFLLFFIVGVIPAFHVNERYFLPLMPSFFIWVGPGVIQFYKWLGDVFNQLFSNVSVHLQQFILWSCTACFLILGIIVPQMGPLLKHSSKSREYYAEPVEQKRAGLWIKANCDKIPIILSHGHTVDFYAGNYDIKKTVSMPDESIEDVIKYARIRNADYILLNERYKADFKKIAWLLDEKDIPKSLNLVWTEVNEAGLKSVLFKVVE